MIMLGALLNIINIASKQAAISALSESIPKNTLQENVKAVEAGLEIRGS
jgi:Pyruvate/2-oxoacid:ferredoxin oxidoreductase gamma subunit